MGHGPGVVIHMRLLILASSSRTRAQILQNAGLRIEVRAPRIDEAAMRESLEASGAKPRDVADALAEYKAMRIAGQAPAELVLGCDQVLEFQGRVLGKPETAEAARERLVQLRGTEHRLLTAAVLYDSGAPVWRHVDEARLTMRDFSDEFLDQYIQNDAWFLTQTPGSYAIETEGVRLFSRIEGDYFGILGLPLLPLLAALTRRGDIPG